ncbi:hypothetical protein [Aurantiacibacter gilvus]|uniref:Glycine zipper family protein n=1 Tax=Aurantiacibacter gilvus TaxID=3139141 RepID=A0ABU9IAM3_9SPHN
MRSILLAAVLAGSTAAPALAQDETPEAAAVQQAALTEEEIAAIPMPELVFEPSANDIDNYEKYFYFHRADTDFNEAYADILECDALASGFRIYAGASEPYPGYYGSQYGIGGVIGGVIGAALADAIHGSAARREARRANMRNCMAFKGYARYGLAKDLWEEFNFEEGNGREPEPQRTEALMQQARVASGPTPAAEAIVP